MNLDPNIILQARSQFDPMESMQKAMSLKQMANANFAQDQEMQQKQQMNDALKSSVNGGQVDHNAVYSKLLQQNPMQAEAYKSKIQNEQREKYAKDHEISSMIFGGATKDNWKERKLQAVKLGVTHADQLPEDADDAFIKNFNNGLLSAKEKMAQEKDQRDFGLRERELAAKRQERLDSKDTQKKEKEFGLTTPYGLANTVEDAKNLKSVDEIKKNFDTKLSEMISLRENSNSASKTFDRDAVGRGQQLSKDLLLAYKDMAKLGVLSAADEKILNAIIPPDPLEYNSPLAAIQGQDPVLHKMKKFKEDSEADFQNRLKNRLRNPEKAISTKDEIPDDEHREAYSWALKNTKDPRAKQILDHSFKIVEKKK